MRALFAALFKDEAGQDMAEYGIALAVIAAGAVLVAVALGQDVQTIWERGQNAVGQAVN